MSSVNVFSSDLILSSYVQTYDLYPTVVTLLDGVEMARTAEPGDHSVQISTYGLSTGTHKLEVRVYDQKGRIAGARVITFQYRKS